jgi:hypothetical protein
MRTGFSHLRSGEMLPTATIRHPEFSHAARCNLCQIRAVAEDCEVPIGSDVADAPIGVDRVSCEQSMTWCVGAYPV